jgi:carbon-monoxide dehydrogenase medium subunit
MHPFSYHRAASVEDAVLRIRAAADGRFLAGGMTLVPVLKQRLAQPSDVIDLGRLVTLRAITAERDVVTIGALATHAAVARSPVVGERLPALARLAAGIGDAQVRHRGTIGGSLANNDPAADYPAAVLALAATIGTDRRTIAAEAFFTGMFATALAADELITQVVFRRPLAAGYAKLRQPASGYPLVGVFVAQTAAGVRVAVTGAAPRVFRAEALERALAGNFSPAAVGGVRWPEEGLLADLHASPAYRAHLIGVLARRAVQAALG